MLNDEDAIRTNANAGFAISQMLTPDLWKLLGTNVDPEISNIYDGLIDSSIAPLSRNVPNRVRVAVDKILRHTSSQVLLASYAARQELSKQDENPTQDETSVAGTELILPVRGRVPASVSEERKRPAAGRSSSRVASSQLSEDGGFLPSSPIRALPTPEPTPSLRSQSSHSSVVEEDGASQRLRKYVRLKSQPALPSRLSANVLGHWQEGLDPSKYDWEAAQQAFANEDEEEPKANTKEAKSRQKRQRKQTFGPSSQPSPKRLNGSQPEQIQVNMQGSGQAGMSGVSGILSQPEAGRQGRSQSKGKQKQASGKRLPGF